MLVIILLKKGKKEISIVVKKYENIWVYTFSRKHSVTNPKVNSDEYDIHFFRMNWMSFIYFQIYKFQTQLQESKTNLCK